MGAGLPNGPTFTSASNMRPLAPPPWDEVSTLDADREGYIKQSAIHYGGKRSRPLDFTPHLELAHDWEGGDLAFEGDGRQFW
jgi:hypothetical protein